jgi:hypothetical protein
MSIEQPTFEICDCQQTYSIEPHGPAHVIYFGRCQHRHGYNLATLTELSANCELKRIEKCLITGHESLY